MTNITGCPDIRGYYKRGLLYLLFIRFPSDSFFRLVKVENQSTEFRFQGVIFVEPELCPLFTIIIVVIDLGRVDFGHFPRNRRIRGNEIVKSVFANPPQIIELATS